MPETHPEPITRKAIRYLCPFCRKGRWKKSECVDHIAQCHKNPAVRGCLTCGAFERTYADEDGPMWTAPEYQRCKLAHMSLDGKVYDPQEGKLIRNCSLWSAPGSLWEQWEEEQEIHLSTRVGMFSEVLVQIAGKV